MCGNDLYLNSLTITTAKARKKLRHSQFAFQTRSKIVIDHLIYDQTIKVSRRAKSPQIPCEDGSRSHRDLGKF